MAKGKSQEPDEPRRVATNRRARFRYSIGERFEAGVSLLGNEVKSIRQNGVALDDAFARFFGDELFLVGAKIAPYDKGRLAEQPEDRKRKLLLKRRELRQLQGRLRGSSTTLVPLAMYFRRGWAKVELGLARGKGGRDRRQEIVKREHDRELARARKRRR